MFWVFDHRVRIADLGEIRCPWLGSKLFEQAVIDGELFQPPYLAFRVVDISKDDRLGWASLLAGRNDLPILDFPSLYFSLDARDADALHTIGAFLHYAPSAHGHVRVVQQSQGNEIFSSIIVEIKTPHFICA